MEYMAYHRMTDFLYSTKILGGWLLPTELKKASTMLVSVVMLDSHCSA